MQGKAWFLLFFVAASLHCAVCQDFCYRSNITNTAATNGNAASRANEVETAVADMLNELGNSANVDFTTNDRNQTLEAVEGDASGTVFRVLICLTNSSVTEAEFTQILVDFNFQTQITNSAVSAGDYDECSSGNFNTSCHEYANCNNNNGSFSCACQDEYYDATGNNQTGQVCELPTNFTCSSNTVNVTATNPYFIDLGINYTTLRLGSCSGSLQGNDVFFSGECGPVIEENDTHVFYKWNLTNVNSSSDVTIGNYVTIPITCTYASSSNVSFNVSADRRDIVFEDDLNNLPGQAFDFTAEAFQDNAATNALAGPINTNTKIYFRLGTSNSIPSSVRIRCESFSTSSADGSSSSIELMSGSCPVTRTNGNGRILDTLEIVRNGESGNSVIGITSHFFGTSRITTATFGLVACVEDEENNSTCQISCSGRSKRSVLTYRVKREDVGSGEVQFAFERAPGDGCTRDCNEGGICVYDATRDQKCVCAEGFLEQADGTCKETVVNSGGPGVPGEESTTVIILTCFIAFLAILAAVIVLVFACRRRRRNQKAYDVTFANNYAMEHNCQ